MDLAAATGFVAHLSFNRIAIPAPMPSSFHEMANQSIRQLSFDDLEVAGKCVRSEGDAGFDPPPVDVSFACSTDTAAFKSDDTSLSDNSTDFSCSDVDETCTLECISKCWTRVRSPCLKDCTDRHGVGLVLLALSPFLGRFVLRVTCHLYWQNGLQDTAQKQAKKMNLARLLGLQCNNSTVPSTRGRTLCGRIGPRCCTGHVAHVGGADGRWLQSLLLLFGC